MIPLPDLAGEIRGEIARAGPIRFDRFMELALYHPERGYYRRRRDPFGVTGDYFTNAQLQPVFGRLIAQQIARWRQELGASEFTVVELGAGRGETAAVVRQAIPGIRYLEIERERGALPQRMTGVVFSNEFFDALPVRAARRQGGRWRERLVGEQGGRLVWAEGGPVDPEAEAFLTRGVPCAEEGWLAEANLEALRWIDRIAASLERGYVLTIDYGYTAEEAARFPRGTLMAYTHHLAVEDVLAEPGERDITAHVAWTPLLERAAACGLRPRALRSQAQFLLSVGEADGFAAALAAADEAAPRRHRMLLKTLLYGMGESFQVLIFEK